MILEVAILDVIAGEEDNFEIAFKKAEEIIASIQGYISHELLHCIEKNNRYILLVKWETLEAHTEEFRQSDKYIEWKNLLHHFYDPPPTVEHYQAL